MPEITKADIEAIVQVLNSLGEQSDELPRDAALRLRGELEVLHSVLRRTQALVNTQCIKLLELPAICDGERYVKRRKFVRRYRHFDIAKRIAERSVVDYETGEILDARTAVAQALHKAVKIWCSDSTMAKQGEMTRLLGVGDAEEEGLAFMEDVGTEIKVYPLEGS